MDTSLQIGDLSVTFHRTVRVKEGQISALPPSLGHMEHYPVRQFRATCPEPWDDDAIFIPLHENEAMWMDFKNHGVPVAVLVGAGGINALTGGKLGLTLEAENYLTVPPQPWLDGWKGEDGTVFQFVATEYKKGEGVTVAEQLIGKQSKTGGLGLAVFEPNNPRELENFSRPKEEVFQCGAGGGQAFGFAGPHVDYDDEDCEAVGATEVGESLHYKCASAPRVAISALRRSKASEMGVGKGGKIFQKVYPDPYGGVQTWKSEPVAAVAVYLVDATQFTEITGMPMPPLPASAKEYIGAWYGLKDEGYKDVSGTGKFTGLKSVFNEHDPVEIKKI